MDALLAQRLVVPAGASASTGGRPPKTFAFNRNAGVVLAADLGATHSRVAVTDLAGDVLVETRPTSRSPTVPIRSSAGSRRRSTACWRELARAARRARYRGRCSGAGRVRDRDAGGAADHAGLGRLRRRPPLRERYGAPVLVDNDVNIMALGEYWARWRDTAHLLFVKVGTGIGCGVITDGRIHRGARARPVTSATSTSPTTTT